MKLILVFLVLSSLLALSISATNGNRLRFRYGNKNINFHVNIKVLDPKGLIVSIPNMDGLEMFSFHGSINSPFSDDRDGSIFAHDVTGSIKGEWVYENKDIKLGIGDVLNYWVFIQYKGAGQRFNDLSHIVKKLISNKSKDSEFQTFSQAHSPPIVYPLPTASYNYPASAKVPSAPHCEVNENNLKDVWSQLNMTVDKMQSLEQTIIPLEEKVNSLTETVTELLKYINIGTNLVLTGNLPLKTDAAEDVRRLIVDKLKLSDLSTTIIQAYYLPNGISFEVSSSIDKLRILKRSNDILANSSYRIIDPATSRKQGPVIEPSGSYVITNPSKPHEAIKRSQPNNSSEPIYNIDMRNLKQNK